MNRKNDLQRGWDFSAHLIGADVAVHAGSQYVAQVNEAIEQLAKDIVAMKSNQTDAVLGGYLAEVWHADTFNVDAIAAGSAHRAWVDVEGRIDYGSVDIRTNFGTDYSSKYMKNPEASAIAQAQYARDLGRPKYQGQERLIPTDHLEGALETANRQALRNEPIRPEVAESYREAGRHFTDRVSDGEGIESIPLTKENDLEMARQVKRDEFAPENFGESVATAIKTEYLIKQAAKAGMTTAAITVALQLAPEMYKALDYLIKTGQIDLMQVRRMGTKAISAGAEGFLRGSVSCALYIACEKGLLGEALKGVNSTALGTVVAIVIETLKNSVLVAAGKMTSRQMGAAFVDSVVISAGFVAGTHIGGVIGQALGFQLPGIGYLIGSLLGSAFAVAYNIGKNRLISFCVDSGFTCFGLVDQNYELPEEVLSEMGIDTIQIPRATIPRAVIPKSQVHGTVQKARYETIDIKMVRRGVIGVNRVGYMLG